jgi:hypothetical protein
MKPILENESLETESVAKPLSLLRDNSECSTETFINSTNTLAFVRDYQTAAFKEYSCNSENSFYCREDSDDHIVFEALNTLGLNNLKKDFLNQDIFNIFGSNSSYAVACEVVKII